MDAAALDIGSQLAHCLCRSLNARSIHAVCTIFQSLCNRLFRDLLVDGKPLVDFKVRAVVVVLLQLVIAVLGHERLRKPAIPQHVTRAITPAPELVDVQVAMRDKRRPIVRNVPPPALLVDELVCFVCKHRGCFTRGRGGGCNLAFMGACDGGQLATKLSGGRRRAWWR